jgi:multiple sugar transport system permease protein
MRINYKEVQVHLILYALVFISLFPFYWAISCSFKAEYVIFNIPPEWLPKSPTFDNFTRLFQKTNFITWLSNSLIVTAITVLCVCIVSSLAAYSFAKIKFPKSDIVFFCIIATMMIPKYVLLVPLFRMMIFLKWINTYSGLIIPELASQTAFGIFMVRQFCIDVPDDIIDAARIDGCGELWIFFKIIVPLIKPAIISLAIIAFVKSWNDYMWQLIVTTGDRMKTLPLGIANLNTEANVFYGTVLAGAIMSALPLILVFSVFQKYFTKGLTAGAVKG